MIDPLRQQRRRLHRTYLFQNGFVVLVALLFLIVSASYFLDPEHVDGTLVVEPYTTMWNAVYLTGALVVLIGLFDRRIGVEAAGHIFLVPGLILQFSVAVVHLGMHRLTLLAFIFAVASMLRAVGLVLGWREDHHDHG